MREIKFRGMGVNGEWFHGNLNIITDKRAGVELGSYISNKVGMPFAYLVRPETVGQYTGLEDKNGNPIYEGDIVEQRFTGSNVIGEVRFSPTQGYVVGNHCIWPHDIEVIGNKFDNQNLLQG